MEKPFQMPDKPVRTRHIRRMHAVSYYLQTGNIDNSPLPIRKNDYCSRLKIINQQNKSTTENRQSPPP
jgi:hypothetical protein